MPQYYNHFNHTRVGNIKVNPLPRWRRIFRWWPYFVGDRVMFEIQVDEPPENPYTQWMVFERFGSEIAQIRSVRAKAY
jgi:hypothetical protein